MDNQMNKVLNKDFNLGKDIFHILFLVPLVFCACSQEPEDRRITQFDPKQAAEWAEAIEEQIKPEMADGFTLEQWGSDS